MIEFSDVKEPTNSMMNGNTVNSASAPSTV